MLDGIPCLNRLLFRKRASNGLSKIAGGIGPSKSLNRISKYFKDGRVRRAGGNLPTNLLLLISSSYNSFIEQKVLGTVPQNRFELMWNTARSDNNPSSSGKYPAISAWLRSKLATTRTGVE
jgi:hypothetical protein